MVEQNELKSKRENMKMTQKEFAQILGVPLTTYLKWERGQRKMKPYTLAYVNEVIAKHE